MLNNTYQEYIIIYLECILCSPKEKDNYIMQIYRLLNRIICISNHIKDHEDEAKFYGHSEIHNEEFLQDLQNNLKMLSQIYKKYSKINEEELCKYVYNPIRVERLIDKYGFEYYNKF